MPQSSISNDGFNSDSTKSDDGIVVMTPNRSGVSSPSSVCHSRNTAQSVVATPSGVSVSNSHNHTSHHKESHPGVEFRSGYRGVSWNRRMKAWLAFWSEGKNRRSKTFKAKVLGFEKARSAAFDFLKMKKHLLSQNDSSYEEDEEDDFSVTTTSESPDFSGTSTCCDSHDYVCACSTPIF